jgi:hypothetical protein
MTQRLGWIKTVGLLSTVPCAYFWLGIAAHVLWRIALPFNLFFILACIVLSIPASIVAAVRWVRWMYLVTVGAVSTLLFVVFRLH